MSKESTSRLINLNIGQFRKCSNCDELINILTQVFFRFEGNGEKKYYHEFCCNMTLVKFEK